MDRADAPVTVFGLFQSLGAKVIVGRENVTCSSLDEGVTVTSPVGSVASTSVYVSLSPRATLMALVETLTPASSSTMYTVLRRGKPGVTAGGGLPNLKPHTLSVFVLLVLRRGKRELLENLTAGERHLGREDEVGEAHPAVIRLPDRNCERALRVLVQPNRHAIRHALLYRVQVRIERHPDRHGGPGVDVPIREGRGRRGRGVQILAENQRKRKRIGGTHHHRGFEGRLRRVHLVVRQGVLRGVREGRIHLFGRVRVHKPDRAAAQA